MKTLFYLLFLFLICNTIKAQDFSCPIKDKKAQIPSTNPDDASTPSKTLMIDCPSCQVFSCSNGVVKNIDSSQGILTVDIYGEGYLFAYRNIENVCLKIGQKIKKGQKIGQVSANTDFMLIVYKQDEIVNAPRLVGCK